MRADLEIRQPKRSQVLREFFSSIFESYERDYPTLFSQKELAALIVEPR